MRIAVQIKSKKLKQNRESCYRLGKQQVMQFGRQWPNMEIKGRKPINGSDGNFGFDVTPCKNEIVRFLNHKVAWSTVHVASVQYYTSRSWAPPHLRPSTLAFVSGSPLVDFDYSSWYYWTVVHPVRFLGQILRPVTIQRKKTSSAKQLRP